MAIKRHIGIKCAVPTARLRCPQNAGRHWARDLTMIVVPYRGDREIRVDAELRGLIAGGLRDLQITTPKEILKSTVLSAIQVVARWDAKRHPKSRQVGRAEPLQSIWNGAIFGSRC